MRPFSNKAIIQVELIKKKKPDGTKMEEPNQEGLVLESNIKGINKNDTVLFNFFGAVNIEKLQTKNSLTLIVEAEDIYAII